MSTFIAGFDGRTCCNCRLPADAHLRSYGVDAPEPALLCLEVGTQQVAGAGGFGAAHLARELLALVERGDWWRQDLLGACRACGCALGAGHHPACLYMVLAEQIGRLSGTAATPAAVRTTGVPVP